jgi:integrase
MATTNKLNDKTIQNAKPKAKDYKLADGRGLYLFVTQAGGKYWRLKFRIADKEKRLSLGAYPAVGLKDARLKAEEARSQLSKGVDPSATKTLEAQTFQRVADEWLAGMRKSPSNDLGWEPNHYVRQVARLQQLVYPSLGGKHIADITPLLILDLCKTIGQRLNRDGAPTVETANRVLILIGQVFRYAKINGLVPSNPADGLSHALPKAQEKHHAAVTNPVELGGLLRSLHGYSGYPIVEAALKLAPLVFVRPGELRQARWSDIDFDNKQWSFKASKTKPELIVPLATQAVEILQTLHPITGGEAYVFPSARAGDRPMSDNAILAALRRMGIGREVASGHGFRATARTLLDEVLGFRIELIEHQLAHGVKDSLGRAYNRTSFLEDRRVMMQRWADYLDSLRTGNVIQFPRVA